MNARVSFFARRGDRRNELQDCLLIGPLVVNRPTGRPLFVEVDLAATDLIAVFDGMGGHAAGGRAAALAAAELPRLVAGAPSRRPALEWAIAEAGRRIGDESQLVAEWSGMGTTVVGVHLSEGGARVFNVGDSRAYLMKDRYLCQFSHDHTTAEGGAGASLTQCLGAGLRHVRPHVALLPWDPSALILLCTDGLYRQAGITQLEEALLATEPIDVLWQLAAGASDDAGVVLVDARPRNGAVTSEPDNGLTVVPLESKEAPHVRPKRRFRIPLPAARRSDEG